MGAVLMARMPLIGRLRQGLDRRSVGGEDVETPEEAAKLDSIGNPEQWHVDLVILRLLGLAVEVGAGGLTDEEISALEPLVSTRVGLALALASGDIEEREGADGHFRYFPASSV